MTRFDVFAATIELQPCRAMSKPALRSGRARRSSIVLAVVCLPALVVFATGARAQGPVGTLVVSNMSDHTATIIDAASGRVRATLPTGMGPHEVAVSNDGRLALVSNYGVRGEPGSTITVIDVGRAEVVRTLNLGDYQRPHGMAFLPGDTLAVVTSEVRQMLVVFRVRDGGIVRTHPTSGRATHMVAVSAAGQRAFTANIADGTISRVDLGGADPAVVMGVGRAPEGIAVTPDGNTVWVGSNQDGIVLVVDGNTGTVRDTLRGFGMPYRMAISPDARLAVVTDPVQGKVRVFDATTLRERATLAIPADSLVATAEVPGSASPEGVAISRDSRWAFVTLQGRNRVITIDLQSGTVVTSAPTGTWSDGIGFSPVTRTP